MFCKESFLQKNLYVYSDDGTENAQKIILYEIVICA
jgi:hypothetical protein